MSLSKLLEIASGPISPHEASSPAMHHTLGTSGQQLLDLLKTRNGFFAFETALVVLPTHGDMIALDIWNQSDSWRHYYQDCLPPSSICFAYDIFGCQFCIGRLGVVSFNPETGETEPYAPTLDGWASNLLENYREDTGWPLAHDWQIQNRQILPTERLLPKKPFVLGGDFEVHNLVVVRSDIAMQKYAHLYRTVRDATDGSVIELSDWI